MGASNCLALLRRGFLAAFLIAPWSLWAAESTTAPELATTENLLPAAASWLFSSLLIIAILVAAIWGLKRSRLGWKIAQNPIQIVAAQSVGTRERVVMVEVEGKRYLIGVTAQQITLIDKYSEAETTAVKKPISDSDFAQELARLKKESAIND